MERKTLKKMNIGNNQKIFIIAEAGLNHNGSLDLALKMIDEAKKAGADAIKFQTYITEKRVTKDNPFFSILKKCELSNENQKKIKQYADKVGIIFFSTPFDEESVNFLKSIDIPLIKIASFDMVNKKLLNAIAGTGIPIIISRGMTSPKEIDEAVEILNKNKADYAILHCVSAYPAPKEVVNLRIIKSLMEKYSCPIGYSDHTLDLDASIYAVAVGVTIIEKHFTLNKRMKGPDHKISVNPRDLATLCRKIRELETMLGSKKIRQLPEEKSARIFRRPTEI